MKNIAIAVCLCLFAAPAFAKKSCDELKSEIETKLKTAGVITYTLTVIEADKAADGKVVGSCDGGTKKIVYKKN